jgi:hypothetical protein
MPIIAGPELFQVDNAYDIGASAASRPRSLYVGTGVWTGGLTASAGVTLTGGNLSFQPDNTLDIGATSINRPRNVYVGSNLTVGAIGDFNSLRATGIAAPASGAGTEIIYDASGGGVGTVQAYDRTAGAYKPLYLSGSSVALISPLLFSPDNAYDIGASGANRPRSLYLATNLTLGGQLQIASAVLKANGVDMETGGSLITDAGILFLNAAKSTYVRGDTPSAGWVQAQTNLSVPGKVSFSEGGIIKFLGQFASGLTYSSATTGAWLNLTGTNVVATTRAASGDLTLYDITIPITHSANNAQIQVGFMVDGTVQHYANDTTTAAGNPCNLHLSGLITSPAAGSHTFSIGLVSSTAGTLTVVSGQYTILRVLELRV